MNKKKQVRTVAKFRFSHCFFSSVGQISKYWTENIICYAVALKNQCCPLRCCRRSAGVYILNGQYKWREHDVFR